MPKRHRKPKRFASRISNIFPLILLTVLALTVLLYLPLDPTLTITFTISSSPTNVPIVTINSWTYGKLNTATASSIQKGQILLIAYTNTTGTVHYLVSISVSYGGEVLTGPATISLGIGSYQARVVYSPRSEQSNVPYVVSILAARDQTQPFVGPVLSIFPTS